MSTTPTVFLPILDVVKDHLAVNSVFVFLVIVVVSLRVVGRCIGPGLGWDDALVVAAMPLGIAMHICSGFFAPIGNGYNLAEHPQRKSFTTNNLGGGGGGKKRLFTFLGYDERQAKLTMT